MKGIYRTEAVYMKNTILIKSAMILICTAALLFLNWLLFGIYVGRKLDLKDTYIASRDIPPRTKITESDLLCVRISGRYILDQTAADKDEIIGRYTDIQGKIPAGSPFYRSMLYDEKDLPDQAAAQLKKNQVSFSMEVDVAKLGSIIAGQRVDVYVTAKQTDTPLTGCLIRSARVIAVRDHKGISLESPESSGIPYLVELAINSSHLELLTLAKTAGDLQIYMSADAYDPDAEAVLDENSQITAWLTALKNGTPQS